eukprot:126169-Alexandrium_andersonii.AAC.1
MRPQQYLSWPLPGWCCLSAAGNWSYRGPSYNAAPVRLLPLPGPLVQPRQEEAVAPPAATPALLRTARACGSDPWCADGVEGLAEAE